MELAALILWILTALGGAYLLFVWISKGGHRPGQGSHFPPALIFGHFGLAAAGLILWIVYFIIDNQALAWIAFVVLLLVAVLGFTMLARWIPTYRRQATASTAPDTNPAASVTGPAERHFPIVVVGGHGLLAVTTLVLVLLSALEVGG